MTDCSFSRSTFFLGGGGGGVFFLAFMKSGSSVRSSDGGLGGLGKFAGS